MENNGAWLTLTRTMKIADYCRAARKFPPLFDLSKQGARLLGVTTPLREIIRQQTRALPKVSFLQIGANDGLANDPIREFLCSSRRWEGVLIEPIPETFERLKKNYRYLRHPKLQFLNCAVSDTDGTISLYRVKSEFRDLFARDDRVVSFSRNHLIKHFAGRNDIENSLEEMSIGCIGIERLLMEKCGGQVDVLVMDVEGYESVLLRKIPFHRCKPGMIVYESIHLKDEEEVEQYLRKQGYQIQKTGTDSVAIA